MKVGIDSYCYHRFFGEVYDPQPQPPREMSLEDFIKRAHQLGVDRVYAWGHPDGLEGGKNRKMFDEMMQSIEYAGAIGAEVMRVVGSSLAFRFEPHQQQIDRLSKMFSKRRERIRPSNGVSGS